jgi:hypothetical protein
MYTSLSKVSLVSTTAAHEMKLDFTSTFEDHLINITNNSVNLSHYHVNIFPITKNIMGAIITIRAAAYSKYSLE